MPKIMNISQKPYEDRPKRGGNLDRNSLSLCIFAVDNKTIEMSLLRVMNMFLLVVAVVLTGCEDGVVPENLRIPELPVVSAVAEGRVVTLTATFKSVVELSSAKEFGFYFGEDEQSMERMTVAKTDGLGYSLIMGDLEYSTTYSYKAWVGNGRDEVSSDSREVVTGKEPVGPDPPSPVEQNIEFKDPEVKALCVENWDLDGDGELSKAEAAKVTNLRWVFKRNNEITSFEELEYFTGLRSVADSAFKCCNNLNNIKLPECVKVIGAHAFQDCFKLSLTSLPETLTEIGKWAFQRCANLAFTSLPSGLTSIEEGVFERCQKIVPDELPSGLTRVGPWAFSECSSLNPKSLPEGVKTLGQNAFGGCSSLTWTRLPSSLREMGDWAFAQCWKVGFSSIPEGVVKISKATFEGCFSMGSITLPESLQVIDSLAFNGLPLKEVTIPENVKFIGGDAFKGSDRMVTVKLLPKSPPVIGDTYLGDNADVIYVHAESLKKYKTSENWDKWKDKYRTLPGEELPPDAIDIEFKDPVVKALCVENWDLDGDGELSKAEAAKVTSLRQVFKRNEEITSFEELECFTSLRSVADSAFKCCSNLSALSLPEGVRMIGEDSFAYCSELRITSLPESLTSIERGAFTYCSGLALTELPENLTSVAWFAFDHCTSLALKKLPSGMTRIEGGTFANCPNVAPEKLPSGLTYIGPWAFFGCTSFNPEALPESVTEIDHNAFSLCTSLAWARLPDNVVEIGEAAFTYCYKLSLTSLPPKLTRIENEAFNETSVAPAELPNGLKYIGERAFMNCSEFNPANLPSCVVEIGARAFFGCSSLSWRELPESLMEVGEYAFYLCRKVKFTSLPENIIKIHKAVFENCTGMEEITLPDQLNVIEANAFKNCKFLEITIPKNVEFIGSEAFNGGNLLRKVTVLPAKPPQMEDTFLGDNANVVFVPSASLEMYKTAKNWSEWKDKYKPLTESSGKAL